MKTRLLVLAFMIVFSAACGPSPQDEAVQREATRQSVDVTSTAQAAPTVAAKQTADAQTSASQTAILATAVAQSTAQAATTMAMATQQSRDVDARVLAAISATQAAIPTATPIPATPIVIVVTQQPAPAPAPVYVPVPVMPAAIYVPVPVPAPGGSAPDWVSQAINESNNASAVAKWSLNANDLLGHVVYRELSRTQDNVAWLNQNRTRVKSLFMSGWVTSWSFDSPTRVTAIANETWHFVDYDADSYTVKRDLGIRLYRNIYTIENLGGAGWKVSFDDVPNPSGEAS